MFSIVQVYCWFKLTDLKLLLTLACDNNKNHNSWMCYNFSVWPHKYPWRKSGLNYELKWEKKNPSTSLSVVVLSLNSWVNSPTAQPRVWLSQQISCSPVHGEERFSNSEDTCPLPSLACCTTAIPHSTVVHGIPVVACHPRQWDLKSSQPYLKPIKAG